MRAGARATFVLIASILVVAPFALGGAARWAVCLTSALALASPAGYLGSRREFQRVSPLLALIAVAALATLIQIVPLPAGLIAFLSPGKYQLVVANAGALREAPPAWIALSLDPAATLLELAKLGGYFAFAYAALHFAHAPPRRRRLVAALALLGTAMAVTTLVHLAVGAETVFGLYRPHQAMIRPTIAPLLNQNHLSALMALTAPMALGLALASTRWARVGWLAAGLTCAGVGLLAESRGGALALVLGVGIVGIRAVLSRRRGDAGGPRPRRADTVAIAVLVMSTLVVLGALAGGGVVRDLSNTQLAELGSPDSRFGVWRESGGLLDQYRWTGIGRGAFEYATTQIHDSSSVVYPHLENEYLQAVVDWGFVVAAALAILFIWLGATAAARARASLWETGAFAGLAALAVENLTDFSLWLPGIAYPAIAAAAVLTYAPVTSASLQIRRRWLPVRLAGLAAIGVVVALVASPLGASARTEIDALRAAPGTGAPAIAAAAEVFERHPADAGAAGELARALFLARDTRAIAVVNRALWLHATSGELHHLTARMLLASQQRRQATVEFALALRYAPTVQILDEVLAAFPIDADAARALPVAPGVARQWAEQLLERGRGPLAVAYLQRYLALMPDDVETLRYAATVAIGRADPAAAVRYAQHAYDLRRDVDVSLTLARALVSAGDPARALAVLRTALADPQASAAQRVDLLQATADVQVAQGALAAARDTLRAALALAVGASVAQIQGRLTDLEHRLGDPRAGDLAPTER
jgi:tetratricopeptide (TPR) repeat protein